MADHGIVGIYFIPSDGFHWAEFLQQKLKEDGYNIQSRLLDLTSENQKNVYETNILLVSPDFFKVQNLNVLRLIDPHRSLMVLLGTEAIEVQNFLMENKMSRILESITLFETHATENCVKQLLIGIIKLYEHVHENSDEDYDTLPAPRPSSERNSDSQPPNDIYRVAVSVVNDEREVIFLCNRKGADEVKVQLSNRQGYIHAVHENKAVYKFTLDKNIKATNLQFTANDGAVTMGTGTIRIPTQQAENKDKDQPERTSKQSKLDILQDLLGKEDDPVCLMCQALNIKERTREALDSHLAKKCQCLEPLRRFDGAFFDKIDSKSSGHSNDLWPTLIHFAAEFNLSEFCSELLKFPWSMDACLKLNKNSETPEDIAKQKENIAVADLLERFTEKHIKNGNVPGNKDSGVVEDDAPGRCSSSSSQSEYVRPESFLNDEEEPPPPPPHSTKTYMNVHEADSIKEKHPRQHSAPAVHISLSEGSDLGSDNLYMDMSSKVSPVPTIPPREHAHRTKSEGQESSFDKDDDGDDEEDNYYEVPDEDLLDNEPLPKYHESKSAPNMSAVTSLSVSTPAVVEYDVQLPTLSEFDGSRHSGFFKKFKLFKKPKKEKPKRGRKLSLPDENDLKQFQQKRKGGRRGSVQQSTVTKRDSSSSTSSAELGGPFCLSGELTNPGDHAGLHENSLRAKPKHFLSKNNRKSMRIKAAIGDKINPLPLPKRTALPLPPQF